MLQNTKTQKQWQQQWTMNHQQQNRSFRTDYSQSHLMGLKLDYMNWPNSAVVKTQHLFSSHGGFLTNTMYHYMNTCNLL